MLNVGSANVEFTPATRSEFRDLLNVIKLQLLAGARNSALARRGALTDAAAARCKNARGGNTAS